MSNALSTFVTRNTLRTGIALFVGLTLTGVALAQPNNGGGGGGKNRTHCEDVATADYQFNMQSCRDSLVGEPQQESQCEQDASEDYLRTLAACGNIADISSVGHGLTIGGGLTSSNPGRGNPTGGRNGNGNGLVFANGFNHTGVRLR